MLKKIFRQCATAGAVIALATVASAQPPTPQRPPGVPPAGAAQPAVPPATAPDRPVERARPPGDLDAVAARLSRTMNKQFVVDPRLRGIDFGLLDNDEIDYALLQSLLMVQGGAAIETDDFVYIVHESSARLYSTPLVQNDDADLHGATIVSRVITTVNLETPQLLGVVRPLASQSAVMAVVPPNKILVVDRYDTVRRLTEVVRALDQR